MSPAQLLDQVRAHGRISSHVAIVMDGNGRWAAERGLPRHLGHREGMKSVRGVIHLQQRDRRFGRVSVAS